MQVIDKAGDVVEPVGADRAGQAVGCAVGDTDRVVDVLEPNDG